MKSARVPFLLFVLAIIILPVSCTCSPVPTSTPALTVHFIDVGQGDSILIDLGQTEILIDGGEKTSGVTDYIRTLVDGDLDALVATHTDADHIGGLIDVLAQYKVGDIWINGYTATSATFQTFTSGINSEGAVIHQAALGDTIHEGSLILSVLNPSRPLYSEANNNSIVLVLRYDRVTFLFTGDAEKEAENREISQTVLPLPDVDILKVGHHASRTASSPGYLSIIKPEVAIYSCALENRYGHPHQETLDALRAAGATVYGTEHFGTVKVTTDGKTYSVQTEKRP